MSQINLNCTNRNCNADLTFSSSQMGSMQSCPNCGQKLYVPEEMTQELEEFVPHKPPTKTFERPQQLYSAGPVRSLERDDRGQRTRKVKMGSGCLAMFAVMFAVVILGVGYNLIIGMGEKMMGLFTILAGLGGIVAFVYFGYWATETEDRFEDRRRH